MPAPGIPAGVIEHAVSALLGGAADGGPALPAVLGEIAAAARCQAVLAVLLRAGRPVPLAAHPAAAGTDQGLLAELGELAAGHQDEAAGRTFTGQLRWAGLGGQAPGRPPLSLLMADAAAAGGQDRVALVLIGGAAGGSPQTQAAARAIAGIVAAFIGRAGDRARLAGRRAAAGQPGEPGGPAAGRDLAQDALTESEARFRVLAKLAPVGIVQMNAEGLCTFVNDRWCELTGMDAADANGVGWASALHPGDAVRIEREWAVAAARGTELRTDCRMVSVSGQEIWVHAAVLPLLSQAGEPAGFLGAVTDVSAAKRAEAELDRMLSAEQAARRQLADQTERLNSLISGAIPGIVVRDEHGRIAQLNQSSCDLFGLPVPAGQLIGAPAGRLAEQIRASFADPDAFMRRMGELSAGRRPVEGQQFSCRDGRTIETDYWPVFAGQEYRGDLWLFWDVSDRIAVLAQRERMLKAGLAARDAAEQAQHQLARQNTRLQELDEAKTQYLATVSHELRTPLTSIVSFAELIIDSRHQLTPQTLESVLVIRRNAERLLRLVGDLLLLTSAEAGVLQLELGEVAVPALIEETAAACSAAATERDVGIEIRAQQGPPLRADPLRLQQALENLLSNAIKFSRSGGQVTITARHDQAAWQIAVTDNGIGIPPGDIGQLFGRFARASNARSAGLPGTGLGLSIVKAITELHGGRAEVRSEPGRGTTFTLNLPLPS
jgi:PAS domain S-box-containing protein